MEGRRQHFQFLANLPDIAKEIKAAKKHSRIKEHA